MLHSTHDIHKHDAVHGLDSINPECHRVWTEVGLGRCISSRALEPPAMISVRENRAQ